MGLTVQIISAHVGYNQISGDALPSLIQGVFQSLATLGTTAPELDDLLPAVPINRSVFPDYIVCLEDGMKLKLLKRHLRTSYGLTPDAYRAKWKLSPDYPMVAPNYTIRRSAMAKQFGLGRKPVRGARARRAQGGSSQGGSSQGGSSQGGNMAD